MNEDVVEREYPYRGRAPGFALVLTWGFVLACLHRGVTDEGPIRGRDGRFTIEAEPAGVIRTSCRSSCLSAASPLARKNAASRRIDASSRYSDVPAPGKEASNDRG
jgi:hypothetical protein